MMAKKVIYLAIEQASKKKMLFKLGSYTKYVTGSKWTMPISYDDISLG
jgi:hypothetical protein